MTSAMGAEKEDREIVLLRQIADVAEALLDTKNLEASPFLGYNRGLTEAQELRQCLRDLRLLQVREPTPPAAPARATSEGFPPGYDANGRPLDICACKRTFMDAENYRDHLPCEAVDWSARGERRAEKV